MTDKILADMIKSEIDRAIQENAEEISRQFLKSDPGITPKTVSALTAAISISAQLSVQYVIRFLENSGLLALPEDGQPLLRLLPEEPHP